MVKNYAAIKGVVIISLNLFIYIFDLNIKYFSGKKDFSGIFQNFLKELDRD